jgi:hypothetical protein
MRSKPARCTLPAAVKWLAYPLTDPCQSGILQMWLWIVATTCHPIDCNGANSSARLMAQLAELDHAIVTMSRLMVRAGNVITGGIDLPVKVSAVVRYPQCLGDVRKPEAKGQALWVEIKNLIDSGALLALDEIEDRKDSAHA